MFLCSICDRTCSRRPGQRSIQHPGKQIPKLQERGRMIDRPATANTANRKYCLNNWWRCLQTGKSCWRLWFEHHSSAVWIVPSTTENGARPLSLPMNENGQTISHKRRVAMFQTTIPQPSTQVDFFSWILRTGGIGFGTILPTPQNPSATDNDRAPWNAAIRRACCT